MSKVFLLCIVGMVMLAGQGLSQDSESAHLYAQIFDEKGVLESSLSLDKLAALNFDFEKYVIDNQDVSRLRVSNIIRSEMQVDKHLFDSKEASSGDQLCKSTVVSAAPALGIVVKTRDDLNGVSVERVVAGGPAAEQGLQVNDIIYEFNNSSIDSYCDLKMAVAETEIGSNVPLRYESYGKSMNKLITVGAKTINSHTYAFCDEKEEAVNPVALSGLMATYPNPTRKSSFINYKSDDIQPVKLSVMDMNGFMIHTENHKHFSGELRLEYVFEQTATPGVYLFIIEQSDEKYYSRVLYVKN